MVTPLLSVAALLPLALLLFAMVRLRWSTARAGVAGWLLALALALTLFQTPLDLLLYAHGRSLLLSLFVLYIIWMALLLYHVVDEAGAIEDISRGITRLTGDKLVQLLMLSWIFASFLQGATGFGVPVAVVTPLLIGLGFDPMLAVVATGVAHGWAVTYGSVGTSFFTLIAVTDLPGALLAPDASLLLGAMALLCGGMVAHLYGGWGAVRRGSLFILVAGGAMAVAQYALAAADLWAVASFGAGLAGLLVAVPLARLPRYRGETMGRGSGEGRLRDRLPVSLSAYLLLLLVILAPEVVPGLAGWLNRVELNYTFPAGVTGLGWSVPGGPGRSVSLFGHPGALILYTALLAYLIYRAAGRYRPDAGRRIARTTLARAERSTYGILALVAMALVMDNSGMVFAIADGLRRLVPGLLYPIAAPLIGALGAFMTGSNTNSNVLFAPLQQQVAALLDLSVPAILAAQTTGGAVGSTLAPAKIIVGASTASIAGQEGEVLARSVGYVLVLLLAAGAGTYLLL